MWKLPTDPITGLCVKLCSIFSVKTNYCQMIFFFSLGKKLFLDFVLLSLRESSFAVVECNDAFTLFKEIPLNFL